LLIFDEVTDKNKLVPFFMAHGVESVMYTEVVSGMSIDHFRFTWHTYWV